MTPVVCTLDGRNRAIAIAESLATVIAAIRITGWRSYFILKTQNSVLIDSALIGVAIRIARLAFVGVYVVFVSRGTAEWPARVDRVRCPVGR